MYVFLTNIRWWWYSFIQYLSAHIYRSCLACYVCLLNEFNVHHINFFTVNLAMPQIIFFYLLLCRYFVYADFFYFKDSFFIPSILLFAVYQFSWCCSLFFRAFHSMKRNVWKWFWLELLLRRCFHSFERYVWMGMKIYNVDA